MALALRPIMTIEAQCAEPIIVGRTPVGNRMVVPVIGGTFSGPEISGTILQTGSDWNYYRPEDEGLEIWARYDLQTSDGWYISLLNDGMGHVTPDVPMKVLAAEPIGTGIWDMKVRTHLEAPFDSPYAWMNRAFFVSEVPFPTKPMLATIHVHELIIE